jgi:3,4-dihydroxy-9,10-secoandrosta-1,3,5(10)-triene-9,17-dione 4,5-dioxygenase
MTNDVRRLAYIEIEAKDLQAWHTFAQDVLCAQVVPGNSPDTLLLRMDDRIFRVALKQGPMDDICALGLELDNQQAFERTRNALQAAGHLPVMGTQAQRGARGVT